MGNPMLAQVPQSHCQLLCQPLDLYDTRVYDFDLILVNIVNNLKDLGLRKFPASLYHCREITSTAEFGHNVDIAIIPVKVHQLKNEAMSKLLEQPNLSDQVVSACLRQSGLQHNLHK